MEMVVITYICTVKSRKDCIMKRPILEYTKEVLAKVSFDPSLFCKELQKAIDTLLTYEIDELKVWLDAYTKNKPELEECMVVINK